MSDILKQLKGLKKVQPNKDWELSNRKILFNQIRAEQRIFQQNNSTWEFGRQSLKRTSTFIKLLIPVEAVAKPVGVVILVLALALGGGVATVSASLNSLPGDVIYPLKIMTEKVQLSLTIAPQDKTYLSLEFAGRRLDELGRIKDQDRATKAVNKFKENLDQVKNQLEGLDNSQKIEMAKTVGVKTTQYESALQKSSYLEEETIRSALHSIEEANTYALRVIIHKTQAEESTVSLKEATKLLQEKINRTEAKIMETASVRQVTATTGNQSESSSELQIILEEAKVDLANNNLEEALNKVVEISQQAIALELAKEDQKVDKMDIEAIEEPVSAEEILIEEEDNIEPIVDSLADIANDEIQTEEE